MMYVFATASHTIIRELASAFIMVCHGRIPPFAFKAGEVSKAFESLGFGKITPSRVAGIVNGQSVQLYRALKDAGMRDMFVRYHRNQSEFRAHDVKIRKDDD